jgi:hypothetical protein
MLLDLDHDQGDALSAPPRLLDGLAHDDPAPSAASHSAPPVPPSSHGAHNTHNAGVVLE